MTYISGSSVGTLCLGSLCFPVKRVNKGAPVSFTGIELRKLLEHLAGAFLRAFVAALGVGFFVFLVQCCRTRGRSTCHLNACWGRACGTQFGSQYGFLARDVFLFGAVKGRVSIASTVAAGWLDCGAMSCQEGVVWLGSRASKW